ncbi:WD40 repeat domain-containing protein, partial [Ralstonia insidiosa]|uniref:WD40 repeat domain-containing protein n=1 Tax=Ralstonia insidiosa TaxID=190721 RepID=UPI001427D386
GFLRSILLGALGLLQLTGWAQEMEVSVAGNSAEFMRDAVFSANEKIMVSEPWGKQLVVWDTSTFRVLTTIERKGVWSLSPDGKTMAMADNDRHRLDLLNASNGKEIASWDWLSDGPRNGHLQTARAPTFRADGKIEMILSEGNDVGPPEQEGGRYQLYGVVLDPSLEGALIKELPTPLRVGESWPRLFGNGRYLLVEHYISTKGLNDSGFVEVFDTETGKRIAYKNDRTLERLRFGEQSATIVSQATGKWVVSNFDYASGTVINRGALPIGASECMPFDTPENGRILLMTVGEECRDLAVYDLQSLRKIAAFAGAGEFGGAALSSDGRWLAGRSCKDWQKSDESAGCKVFAYDLTAGRMRVEWPVTAESFVGGRASAIVMSPNGTFVAIGERLMVWNTMSGRQVVPN